MPTISQSKRPVIAGVVGVAAVVGLMFACQTTQSKPNLATGDAAGRV